MSDVTITREVGPTKGRYVAKVSGIGPEGELTYSRANAHLIIADHTEVPEALRGEASPWRSRPGWSRMRAPKASRSYRFAPM